ncbi:UNVERIFIED_CONTAM: hypothetical protein Sradi_3807000, partial [Sesamum radiatum]
VLSSDPSYASTQAPNDSSYSLVPCYFRTLKCRRPSKHRVKNVSSKEAPSNALRKQKAMETAASAQALQVLPGAPLGPTSAMTVAGPPRLTD